MLAQALLKTSLLLWLVQHTLQGGVGRQAGVLGRLTPGRSAGLAGAGLGGAGLAGTGLGGAGLTSTGLGGAGFGVAGPVGKPGGAGVLGSRSYAGGKSGGQVGRYLGGLGYGTRGGMRQGYGAALGGYGSNLGAGLGLWNGFGGRGLTNGYRYQPGYGAGGYLGAARVGAVRRGAPTGSSTKASKSGYSAGQAPPAGQGLTSNGVGAAPGVQNGPGALMNGGAVSHGNGAKTAKHGGYGLGAGVYPGTGLTNGYGLGLGPGAYPQTGRMGKPTGFGSVYGINGYGDGYGAGLGAGGYGAPGLGLAAGLGAGLGTGMTSEAKSAKYGGAGPGAVIGTAAGQPVVSAGLGTTGKTGVYGGASYVGQPGGLGIDAELGAGGILEPITDGAAGQLPYNGVPVIPAGLEGDNGAPYQTQQLSLGGNGGKLAYGYGAALGAGGQRPYGGKDGSKNGVAGYYGNGIKG